MRTATPGRGPITRRQVLAAAVTGLYLVAVGFVAGCGGTSDQEKQRERIEEAQPRTDVDPITKRWPQLGGIQEAHWVGGTLTDDGAPGPSSYFVEAVVVLAPADVARLTSQHHFAPAPTRPDPPASLKPYVREGNWLSDGEVDQAFTPPQWVSQIYVQPDNALAYISAKGQ